VSAARAGRTSSSSPMPPWPARISVSAPAGQPPPGGPETKAWEPVGTAGGGEWGARPSQTGCFSRRSCRASTILYFHTVSALRLAAALRPADLGLVGAHEVAAKRLVEVVLRLARQLVLLGHEQLPEPALAARQAEALL